ncbi:MAG: hypothetical protein HY453_01165 [Parcubacteria group bacterium]|nr:hypothetical protein [Parcubacteria group bacterium]
MKKIVAVLFIVALSITFLLLQRKPISSPGKEEKTDEITNSSLKKIQQKDWSKHPEYIWFQNEILGPALKSYTGRYTCHFLQEEVRIFHDRYARGMILTVLATPKLTGALAMANAMKKDDGNIQKIMQLQMADMLDAYKKRRDEFVDILFVAISHEVRHFDNGDYNIIGEPLRERAYYVEAESNAWLHSMKVLEAMFSENRLQGIKKFPLHSFMRYWNVYRTFGGDSKEWKAAIEQSVNKNVK